MAQHAAPAPRERSDSWKLVPARLLPGALADLAVLHALRAVRLHQVAHIEGCRWVGLQQANCTRREESVGLRGLEEAGMGRVAVACCAADGGGTRCRQGGAAHLPSPARPGCRAWWRWARLPGPAQIATQKLCDSEVGEKRLYHRAQLQYPCHVLLMTCTA